MAKSSFCIEYRRERCYTDCSFTFTSISSNKMFICSHSTITKHNVATCKKMQRDNDLYPHSTTPIDSQRDRIYEWCQQHASVLFTVYSIKSNWGKSEQIFNNLLLSLCCSIEAIKAYYILLYK